LSDQILPQMKKTLLCLVQAALFLLTTPDAGAQLKPIVSRAVHFDKTPPLREMTAIAPGARDRSWKEGVIRNEDSPRQRNANPMPLPAGEDPVLQSHYGNRSTREPFVNFEGVDNRNSVYPPDTDGDVGPNHYFQMINLSFQVFDKQGNSLYGPVDNSTLWSGFIGSWTGTNDGDPIILYDEMADRWIASQFAIETGDGTYWQLIAVSASGDPLGEYYRYAFQYPVFNDYPKMGVWPDAYYFTFNMFGSDYRRVAVSAHDRAAMMAGDSTARMVLFDLPEGSEPWSMLPADLDGPPPPAGAPNYVVFAMDDAFGAGDQLILWEFDTDWDNPENSTFQEVHRLDVEPFDSQICPAYRGRCIPQPEDAPLLESLSDRLMFRLQYRNFGTYQAMVTNHTVDVDGMGHAGIRWYELRDYFDGNGWSVYQQGTYAPDEHNRWMGSIAMDGRGYIALGFSVSSLTKYPSIHYTGRSPSDPLGEMTFYEEEIMAGSGSQTGDACRWGDYSMMSVDPANDTTFWYTTEYMEQTGMVRWQTRIAGFTLVEDYVAPAPVADLVASETTTNAIGLQWTATGNDGDEGTAFLYDIRYSKAPIDEGNFEEAPVAENDIEPAESGMPETFRVEGLDFSTRYYFAMKVRDRQFNFSSMSNTVSAITPGAPELDPQEAWISEKLFPGSSSEKNYVLYNNGSSDIYFHLIKDTLGASSSVTGGEITGTFQNAASVNSGMVWAGESLYIVDLQGGVLLKYDPVLQAIADSFDIHPFPFGITFDGSKLWIGDKYGVVKAYGLGGTPTGEGFNCPFSGYPALTWDGSHFLCNFILSNDPVVYRVTADGSVDGFYKAEINGKTMWQIAWVPQHHSGQLWMTNNGGIIAQLYNEGDKLFIRKQFPAPFSQSYALAHDNADLWYGRLGGLVYRIDDGLDEINWMTVTPTGQTIPAVSSLGLDLSFDTEDLSDTLRTAALVIFSNDPDEPELRIPVRLDITRAALPPDTSFCGHLAISLDAGDGFSSYLWSDGHTGQVNTVDSADYGFGSAVIWVDVTDNGGVTDRDSISITFQDCTSIFEFGGGATVSVYPNPSDGAVTVQANGFIEDLQLTITDMNGKEILRRYVPGTGTGEINLVGYPQGSYLLKISTGRGTRIEKLLIR
jgi:hypothetical protein